MADDVVDAQAEDLKKRAETLRPEYPEVTFKSFLEETPPDTYVYVVDLKHSADGRLLETPDITFFCEGAACDGQRIFTCRSNIVESSEWRREFLTYQCRNCGARLAIFAISYSVGTL